MVGSGSRCQSSIGETFGSKQLGECFSEEVRILPIVEPPRQFIEVGFEVLETEFVIGANDGPLEQTPDVLHGVRVDVSPDPFFVAVVDHLVPGVFVGEFSVGPMLVGDEPLQFGERMAAPEGKSGRAPGGTPVTATPPTPPA